MVVSLIIPEITGIAMSPAEAARLLQVSTNTLRRWNTEGKVSSYRTLGGHRRFYVEEIVTLYQKRLRDAVQKQGG